ncbi:HPr family phosphocarrier protein [Peribacillus sp. SCS-155]|uniref:HPr family phosphocarrier protein n=1 Tax=Peribacillus sedimenti TaxID=3115297 RepID=UPI003906BCE4
MLEKELAISIENGLHARPAADLVKGLKQFSSAVELYAGNKQYNAKSVLSLMSASIKQGEMVRIKTSGSDEQEAMDWIAGFLTEGN